MDTCKQLTPRNTPPIYGLYWQLFMAFNKLQTYFAIICGMTISADKLIAPVIQWPHQSLWHHPDALLIHTKGWIPHTIKLQRNATYKTYGVHLAPDRENRVQYALIREYISEVLHHLRHKRASAD
jgi:hypothetical protein